MARGKRVSSDYPGGYVAYATHAVGGWPYHAIRRVPAGDRPMGVVTADERARRVEVRAPQTGSHRTEVRNREVRVGDALLGAGAPADVVDGLIRAMGAGARWSAAGQVRSCEGAIRWLEGHGCVGYGGAVRAAWGER